MRLRGAEVEAKWLGLIKEQEQSGQSVASFCRERGVPASQVFAWKRRMRERAKSGFVAVHAGAAGSVGRSETIEVRLVRGRSLVIGRGFDADHLRALLAVLETES